MRRLLTAIFLAAAPAAATAIAVAPVAQASEPTVDVRKTATCGCCGAWVGHLKQSGLKVQYRNVSHGALALYKKQQSIPPRLSSCHTAKVGGYVIEGHVPAREIKRLLREKPDAIGLTVPGMPVGSPGMEDGTTRDAYEVLLIRKDGSTEVYARYPARK